MTLFISWSGERSKRIAETLRDWIPGVLKGVKTWVSGKDIGSGRRWVIELAKELTQADAGIICLTPENYKNPWILFESGALTRFVDQGVACPYLFDMDQKLLEKGPLAQFQSNQANETGTRKLIYDLNTMLGAEKIEESRLGKRFDTKWPDLKRSLTKILNYTPETPTELCLKQHKEFKPFEILAADALECYVFSFNAHNLLNENFKFFKEKLRSGMKFRVLILDPKGVGFNAWSQLAEYSDNLSRTKSAIHNLKDLSKLATEDQVEIRLCQSALAYSAVYVKEPQNEHLVIQFYTYAYDEKAKLHTILSKHANEYWFDLFYKQIEEVWKNSEVYRLFPTISALEKLEQRI